MVGIQATRNSIGSLGGGGFWFWRSRNTWGASIGLQLATRLQTNRQPLEPLPETAHLSVITLPVCLRLCVIGAGIRQFPCDAFRSTRLPLAFFRLSVTLGGQISWRSSILLPVKCPLRPPWPFRWELRSSCSFIARLVVLRQP